MALGAELIEHALHVAGIPEHDHIQHRTQGAELILLALPVALA
jgi:hypothetical protein